MADSFLFDVVLFNPCGDFEAYAGKDMPFTSAVALSRGVNDHRKPTQATAVVMPAGEIAKQEQVKLDALEKDAEANIEAYHKGCDVAGFGCGKRGFPGTTESRTLEAIRDLASDALCDASSEQDDSEVEEDTDDATQSEPKPSVFDEVAKRRAKFVRREFKRQLKRIMGAIDLVEEACDLGIVAASLEEVARACQGLEAGQMCEPFDYGHSGDFRYTELEAALGVVR